MKISRPPSPIFRRHITAQDLWAPPIPAGNCWNTCASRSGTFSKFIRDANHVSPPWPAGYWPPAAAPPTHAAWQECVGAFLHDAEALQALVSDPAIDLTAPLPHGEGQTLLREALLVADHNAYDVGQIIMLRVQLGIWK